MKTPLLRLCISSCGRAAVCVSLSLSLLLGMNVGQDKILGEELLDEDKGVEGGLACGDERIRSLSGSAEPTKSVPSGGLITGHPRLPNLLAQIGRFKSSQFESIQISHCSVLTSSYNMILMPKPGTQLCSSNSDIRSMGITEALRMQMEVQKRLHEQLQCSGSSLYLSIL
ncbi:hypothetical protein RHSIM_Rhsim02G0098100 [Rhododendron simsii]|uniref:MYB-CC type transcription factor LHEQLE-containing domain-containing protein n=1 Tax=Rhododendron simsii TaxID=118357 RepID=A0A834HHU4_RHOSS|nr:hypothetical protein RHSIM_Rhsim02G0098100 [Rhododendron simsii]